EMARRLIAGEITSSRAERRYMHADGHEIHMRESVALVRDADDAPLLFIFQLEDATERIELAAPGAAHQLGSATAHLPVPLARLPTPRAPRPWRRACAGSAPASRSTTSVPRSARSAT